MFVVFHLLPLAEKTEFLVNYAQSNRTPLPYMRCVEFCRARTTRRDV